MRTHRYAIIIFIMLIWIVPGLAEPIDEIILANYEYTYNACKDSVMKCDNPNMTIDAYLGSYDADIPSTYPGGISSINRRKINGTNVTRAYMEYLVNRSSVENLGFWTNLSTVQKRFTIAEINRDQYNYSYLLLADEMDHPIGRTAYSGSNGFQTWQIEGKITNINNTGIDLKLIKTWCREEKGVSNATWDSGPQSQACTQAWWNYYSTLSNRVAATNEATIKEWNDWYALRMHQAWKVHMTNLGKGVIINGMGYSMVEHFSETLNGFNAQWSRAPNTKNYIIQNWDIVSLYMYCGPSMTCANEAGLWTQYWRETLGYDGLIWWKGTSVFSSDPRYPYTWNKTVAQTEFNNVAPYIDIYGPFTRLSKATGYSFSNAYWPYMVEFKSEYTGSLYEHTLSGDAPIITSWGNTKTGDTSLSFSLNSLEQVMFNASANQSITTWNWYVDGQTAGNNTGGFTISFTTGGSKNVSVSATNSNGTSNMITWSVSVDPTTNYYAVLGRSGVAFSLLNSNFTEHVTTNKGTDGASVSIGQEYDTANDGTSNIQTSGTGTWNISNGRYMHTGNGATTRAYYFINHDNVRLYLKMNVTNVTNYQDAGNIRGNSSLNNTNKLYQLSADIGGTGLYIAVYNNSWFDINNTGTYPHYANTDDYFIFEGYGTTFKGYASNVSYDDALTVVRSQGSDTLYSSGDRFGWGGNYQTGNTIYVDEFRAIEMSANGVPRLNGSLMSHYNAGVSNWTSALIINVTTPANTNYSVSYRQKFTGNWTPIGSNYSGNQSLSISGTRYQDTEVNVTMYGNSSAFPEIERLEFVPEAQSSGSSQSVNGTYEWSATGNSTWTSASKSNVTEDLGDQNIKVGVFADNFNDGDYSGWVNYIHWNNNGTGGWSASGNLLSWGGGTVNKWYGLQYNTSLPQNISVMFDSKIMGQQDYMSLFWDTESNKKWQAFVDIDDTTSTNYHLRTNGTNDSDVQVIENLGITPDISNNIYYNYRWQLYGGQYKFYLDNVLKNTSSGNTRLTPNKIGIGTYSVNSSDDVLWDNIRAVAVDTTGNDILSGDLTTWFNASTGNQTWRIRTEVTTPTNTNYTLWVTENGTSNWAQQGGVLTGNQEFSLANSSRFTNTDVRLILNGNQTATPEVVKILFDWQTASSSPSTFIPGTPTNGSVSLNQYTGMYTYRYMIFTWNGGAGNITESYNVLVNRTSMADYYANGTNNWYDVPDLQVHESVNLTVWAVNQSGNTSTTSDTPLIINATLPNAEVLCNKDWEAGDLICNWGGSGLYDEYNVQIGANVTINVTTYDADDDNHSYSLAGWYVTKTSNTTGTITRKFLIGEDGNNSFTFYADDGFSSNVSKDFIVHAYNSTPSFSNISCDSLYTEPGYYQYSCSFESINADLFSVYINDTFIENVSYSGILTGEYPAHSTNNFSVLGYNTTLGEVTNWVNESFTIPNRAPSVTTSDEMSEYTLNESETLALTILNTEFDADGITNSTNATVGTYNTTTGGFSWQTNYSSAGTYVIRFSATDDFDSSVGYFDVTITVTDIPIILPAIQNLANTEGNFFVNWTWEAGIGNVTDSYNVSINGTWTNGSSNPFINTILAPHGWANITVCGFNNTGVTGDCVSDTEQVNNNVPVMNAIGSKSGDEGAWLNFTITGTDADSDSFTCSSNNTQGTLASCAFAWNVDFTDAGTYVWIFYLNDSYGGSDSEVVTITISETTPTLSMSDAAYRVVASGTSIEFIPVASQSIDTYTWLMDGGSVAGGTSYTTSWSRGLHYVTVYGENANGVTNTLEWRISVSPLMAAVAVPTVNTSNFDILKNSTRNYEFETWLETGVLPYTNVMGNMFWLFCWAMIFVAYWIRQKKMTFPTIIALVFGGVFIAMLPEEYQPYARAIIAVGVLGTIYLAFTDKR